MNSFFSSFKSDIDMHYLIPQQGQGRKGLGYLPGTQRGQKGAGSHGSLSEGVGYLQVVQFFGVKISH